MAKSSSELKQRKKEHIEICETDTPAFKSKTTGFEKYDFVHYALTEVALDEICFAADFFGKEINYPFMISCMTGGADEANNVNKKLAFCASELKIPLGLGSLRYALENPEYDENLLDIRQIAGGQPLIGNLGAAQIIQYQNNIAAIRRLSDLIKLDAFIIHLNPLQELMQKSGETNFKGLKPAIKNFVCEIGIPVIIKEVGAGISVRVAEELLSLGVAGIDVAGAGGTSWAGVEILRNKDNKNTEFWDWGLPTVSCLTSINAMDNRDSIKLIASGGINTAFDGAKSLALGADMFASARKILQTLQQGGVSNVISLVTGWFTSIRNIMFLTGSRTLKQFDASVLYRVKE